MGCGRASQVPDPVRGEQSHLSNGLCYSTGAKGKKLEYAREFPEICRFRGRTEGPGAVRGAIPAYRGWRTPG